MDNKFNKENENRGLARRDRSNSVFEPFFDDFFGFPTFRHEMRGFDKMMKTDVKEDENAYKLEVEMPGVDKGDVNIDFNNGYLTIEAKQNENKEEIDGKGNYIRRERYSGSYSRTFYVGDIKEENIDAKLDRGILHINIPKEKKIENKKHIEIK